MAISTGRKKRASSSRQGRGAVETPPRDNHVDLERKASHQPSGDSTLACSTMYDRLKASVLRAAEAWAGHAYLRSCATTLIEEYGTVEDALLACMYHIVILQELEGT